MPGVRKEELPDGHARSATALLPSLNSAAAQGKAGCGPARKRGPPGGAPTCSRQMAKASAMLASTPAVMTAVRSPSERLRSRLGSSAGRGQGGRRAGRALGGRGMSRRWRRSTAGSHAAHQSGGRISGPQFRDRPTTARGLECAAGEPAAGTDRQAARPPGCRLCCRVHAGRMPRVAVLPCARRAWADAPALPAACALPQGQP